MPIGPILPGRIPTSLLAQRLQSDLSRNTRLLTTLQDQVATGQKLFLPSDSPAAAVRSLVAQRQLEHHTQYQATIETDRSYLNVSEQSLNTVSDILNHAKSLLLEGSGNTVSETERLALANEVSAAIQGVVVAANTSHRGRYLFGGSRSNQPPFEIQEDNTVIYHGDAQSVETLIEQQFLVGNNIDGVTAFGVLSPTPSVDLNPSLTVERRLSDLHSGTGVDLGAIEVTLQDGLNTQQALVDLTSAETIDDVRARIEQAFAAGPLTVTVDIDPTSNSGLRLTPSSGTVAVADVAGGRSAVELGIANPAVAVITGGDLNPLITEQTLLADLNGGTGIGLTAGTGIQITLGEDTKTIDLSTAVTVEDLLNAVRLSGLDVEAAINSEGTGIAISPRISGLDFSIGENNGDNATQLGIRTLISQTLLADFNHGRGVPVDEGQTLEITRRDGTDIEVDLSGSRTVQDVLDAINAVDPGVLVASLNATGNGISLLDDDGVSTGPLSVTENVLATSLGLGGEETGTDRTVPLIGQDANPRESGGVFNILARLEKALRGGDNQELSRLDSLLEREIDRFQLVRGEVGSRLQILDQVQNRVLDRALQIKQSLSVDFDTDLTETITQVAQVQTALEASLRIAAQTSQLTLLAFL